MGQILLVLIINIALTTQPFWNLPAPFSPPPVSAAYTGKQMRTVEYVLGCNGSSDDCSDNTPRSDNLQVYAGTSWNTTKNTGSACTGGAGCKNIIIEGSGIKVRHAYLDLAFQTDTVGIDVINIGATLDVEGGPNPGTDIRVAEEANNTIRDTTTTSLSGYIRSVHDVTALFQQQDDTQFNAGLDTVASVSIDFANTMNRTLTTLKLVLTYEQDYSASSHYETKTVRFPLDSNSAGDTGSKTAQCAASTTCSFSYYADLPDAAADGDILDVFFDITAEVDSGTASTLQTGINGGTSGPNYAWGEAITDDTNVSVLWRPSVGGSNFNRSTNQTLNVTTGSVPLNIIGGELVVTYRFDVTSSTQTETIRYFMRQTTTAPGTSKTSQTTISAYISNAGFSVKNLWFKIRSPITASQTFTVYGQVGAASEASNAYTYSGSNPRSGNTATIYYDMSADKASFSGSPTTIGLATQFSSATGDTAIATELYITFTWPGSSGGAVTKTLNYGIAQQGVSPTGNQWNNKAIPVNLSERITKTYRSAYIETLYTHSEAGNLQLGTITTDVNGTQTSVQEYDGTEVSGYTGSILHFVSDTVFSGGATISWTDRTFQVGNTKSAGDEVFFTNIYTITYDAALGEDDPPAPSSKSLRTIEYILGASGNDGSDNTSRSSNTTVYAGSTWNTSKNDGTACSGGAGCKNVIIEGSSIRVRHAYLDLNYIRSNTDTTDIQLTIDVEGGPSPGNSERVGEIQVDRWDDTSGEDSDSHTIHDVTAFFDRQTDSEFNAGLDVVASVKVVGPTRYLTTLKLVITYEQNYSTSAHNETKTVRFPLDSTNGIDTGTRTSVCTASTTCSFTYNASIPDATADADVLDVWFDLYAEAAGSTAVTLTPTINGGTTGPSFAEGTLTGVTRTVHYLFRPILGGSDFARSTSQTLDIAIGAANHRVMGGELVVTYRYNTYAASQTETISYFMRQDTSPPGTGKTAFSKSIYISNLNFSVSNLWFRVTSPIAQTQTFTVFGTVGTALETSQAFAVSSTSVRSGSGPTIIYNMSADSASFSGSPTTIAGATQYGSASGNTPVTVELFVTFTWSGINGGSVTKTVQFGAGQQGVAAFNAAGCSGCSNAWNNKALYLKLPETVTKTHRSSYLYSWVNHSDATAIDITGNFSIGINGNLTTVSETTDTENYVHPAIHEVSASDFSGGATILWNERVFEINAGKSVDEEYAFSHNFTVTYDADFPSTPTAFTLSSYRWYEDNDATNPTDPWGNPNLAENTILTSLPATNNPPDHSAELRLRIALTIVAADLSASSQQFTLQFKTDTDADCTTGSWTDVGAAGSGISWRYADSSVTDGTVITRSLSSSDVDQVYAKSNPTTTNPNTATVGQDIEYDFHLQHNASDATSYSFRVVDSDSGDPVYSYSVCPTLTTLPGTSNLLRHGNFFADQLEKGYLWAN